jgi:hypothetical protein
VSRSRPRRRTGDREGEEPPPGSREKSPALRGSRILTADGFEATNEIGREIEVATRKIHAGKVVGAIKRIASNLTDGRTIMIRLRVARLVYPTVAAVMFSTLIGCAGGSLSTREKAAGVGALGGAAAGGIIGSAVRHPGAGALIGAALGLGAGALVGDQLQGRDIEAQRQDEQIQRNQAELERQRAELERIKRQKAEY